MGRRTIVRGRGSTPEDAIDFGNHGIPNRLLEIPAMSEAIERLTLGARVGGGGI